jgi:AraC-like DNA-binding protein
MTSAGLGRTRQAAAGAPTASEHGVLGVREQDFEISRVPPAADLAALVERHWVVTWDLPPDRRSSVTLLPHPCVNLVFDSGLLAVAGVGRERYTYDLAGRGQVFGVKFRPGGFLPFLGSPVGSLTDRLVPLENLWGQPAAALAQTLGAARDTGELVHAAEAFLRGRWPDPDPNVDLVGQVIEALLYDRSITRVADAATRFGVSARSLQRLFRRYVGVSPKWVLQRYRLHDAAARLADGTSGSWADVAADLGYFDQSHFIRDFARAVGLTPVEYAADCARGQAPVSA